MATSTLVTTEKVSYSLVEEVKKVPAPDRGFSHPVRLAR